MKSKKRKKLYQAFKEEAVKLITDEAIHLPRPGEIWE